MCLGAWGSDWGEIITGINWTLGIGLSLKSLNDKSPLSLSPPSVSSGLYQGCSAPILSYASAAELLKPGHINQKTVLVLCLRGLLC